MINALWCNAGRRRVSRCRSPWSVHCELLVLVADADAAVVVVVVAHPDTALTSFPYYFSCFVFCHRGTNAETVEGERGLGVFVCVCVRVCALSLIHI